MSAIRYTGAQRRGLPTAHPSGRPPGIGPPPGMRDTEGCLSLPAGWLDPGE